MPSASRRPFASRLCALLAIAAFAVLAQAPASSEAASGAYDNFLAPPSTCPGSDTATAVASDQTGAMLCLVDFARSTQGVQALSRSHLLAASANSKAADIARCDDFSHTACGKTVSAPFEESGYISSEFSWDVGENLAFGSDLLGTPRSIMRAWLESDSHRQNLFDAQWRDQGLAMHKPAALLGVGTRVLWVSHFGHRQNAGSAAPAGGPSALRLAVRPGRVKSGQRKRFSFVATSVVAGVRGPAAGATVTFASRRARTNSAGRATISAVLRRPGRYRAVAKVGGLRAFKTVTAGRR